MKEWKETPENSKGISPNSIFSTFFLRYFHKVPAEAPLLELKASYGLAEPVSFELPPLSEQCSAEVYATFDLTKGAKNDKVQPFPSDIPSDLS